LYNYLLCYYVCLCICTYLAKHIAIYSYIYFCWKLLTHIEIDFHWLIIDMNIIIKDENLTSSLCHLITPTFLLRFWQNLCHYFYNVYPTNRPKISLWSQIMTCHIQYSMYIFLLQVPKLPSSLKGHHAWCNPQSLIPHCICRWNLFEVVIKSHTIF